MDDDLKAIIKALLVEFRWDAFDYDGGKAGDYDEVVETITTTIIAAVDADREKKSYGISSSFLPGGS